MRITAISDLHGNLPQLPGGDLLILGGDYTRTDRTQQYIDVLKWMVWQPYEKIVWIAGNHDNMMYEKIDNEHHFDDLLNIYRPKDVDIMYLRDSWCEYQGLKIWGSPWTTTFPGMNERCMAFTVASDDELAEKWKLIPDDTDIVITHSPMYEILDGIQSKRVGSPSLRQRIREINPKLHVCGHIHENGGQQVVVDGIKCVNASYVDQNYDPRDKIISFEMEP